MIKNYLTVALRNIRRNKLYASLNIFGLAVGLSSFFVIYLFIENELAYDQFHENRDRIYRIVQVNQGNLGFEKHGGLTAALAPVAAEEIPEIEAFSRVESWPKRILVEGIRDSSHVVKSVSVDPGFLKIFDFEILTGHAEADFKSPNSFLISETKAISLFGSVNKAIGKTIKVGRGAVEFTVQSVFRDLPRTSSIKSEIILPLETLYAKNAANRLQQWNGSYSDQSYFLLTEDASKDAVEEKLDALFSKNAISDNREITLQQLSDVHFSIDVRGPVGEKTDRQYILIFGLVAAFILICSVFNYVSLALSQSLERTKEIGVRRVIGANRNALYKQFISESLLHVIFSFVLAVILVEFSLPAFEELLGRTLGEGVLSQPVLLIKGGVFSALVAILCALYPAFLSTRLQVVKIFRNAQGGFSQKRLIAALSVLQIAVFVTLISVAFTANDQMAFMRNENLGFDKDAQLVLNRFSRSARSKKVLIEDQLRQIPEVLSTAYASSVPSRVAGSSSFGDYDFRWNNFEVDENYFQTLGINILEGRSFLPEDTDSAGLVIINATAAKKLGFEGDAVGKTIKRDKDLRIIGVVEDFHFASKRELVEAAIFEPINGYFGLLVVKLSGQNMVSTVDRIKEAYKEATGGDEANYFFLEDQLDSQYKQENVMIKMINTFVLIAGVVAFIGLFGISGYAAKRRVKEMGIRKVLGAGFLAIQNSLNRGNMARLILAILIAVPIVIYWMEGWLSGFAYRVAMPYALITGAVFLASMVVFATISFHSIRAFFINPVEILKDE